MRAARLTPWLRSALAISSFRHLTRLSLKTERFIRVFPELLFMLPERRSLAESQQQQVTLFTRSFAVLANGYIGTRSFVSN